MSHIARVTSGALQRSSRDTACREPARTAPEEEDGTQVMLRAGGSRSETNPKSWPPVSIKGYLPDRFLP